MQSEKCKFKHDMLYWDFESGGFVTFKCSEPVIKDGFCIFHHSEYWKENEKELRERFYKKIERARKTGTKLLCIGYNLPSIEIGAEFKSAVYFSWAKFHGKADFSDSKFFGEACFPNAEFFEEAKFSRVHFSGVADFYFVKFFEGVRFYRAKFSERAFFTELRKGSEDGQTFLTEDLLDDAKLKSIVALRKASRTDPALSFLDVEFDKPELVRFNGFSLANTSFLHTDVSRINIGENVSWGSDRRMLDERRADKVERGVTHDVVATVYRRLRQNLESRMRYTEAGRFFIGEMECKRKNVKTKSSVLKWIRTNVFSALAWYKYMSKYGESYSRVVLWIVLAPILASILTTATQTSHLDQFTTMILQNLQGYILAFFQLKGDNVSELVLRIMGLLLMSQLYISLRRQFERRYKG